MREVRFVTLIILFSGRLAGQPDSTGAEAWRVNKYYGSAGAVICHPGVFLKGETGLYFGNNWGVAFEGMQTYYKAKNLPKGYKTGFCLFGDCVPNDRMQVISLEVNREFNLPGKGASIVLGAAPSYVIYDETEFKPASSRGFGSFFEESSFDSFVVRQRVLGLSVHTKLLFRPIKHFAIGVGWFSSFNKARAAHGAEISIVGGALQYRREIPRSTAKSIKIADSLRTLKRHILDNDSIRTRKQRNAALSLMQFGSVSTPALRTIYDNIHNKGTTHLALGSMVAGLGVLTVAAGIKTVPENMDAGLAISGIGLTLSGILGTALFISSGRNLKKAKRIKLEIKRRGEKWE